MADDLSIDAIIPKCSTKSLGLVADISYNSIFLIHNYILDSLINEESVCIVSLVNSPSELINQLSNFSDEITVLINESIVNEKLIIIDGYSYRSGSSESFPNTRFLDSIHDIIGLSIELNIVSKANEKIRFIIWPLSILALYSNPRQIVGFLQTQIARFNQRRQGSLFVIDRGVLEEKELVSIEALFDGILEFKKKENSVENFRVKFLRGETVAKFSAWSELE